MTTDSDQLEFMDVRRHGFVRVAVVVPTVRVADPMANAGEHLQVLDAVYREGAHYALCPELGLTAYTCGDLFFDDTLRRATDEALRTVLAATAQMNMTLTVGSPLAVGGLLYNCAVTLYRGRVLAVAPKSYLPNYREFYERRWFAPARTLRVSEVEVAGERVPIGTDLILRARHLDGFALHVEICEDLWVPIAPSAVAALHGATVLANLSASNVTVAKSEYRRELVVGASARNLAIQMYSAAGYGESTDDLAWDGEGLVAERGVLLAAAERFALRGTSIVVDVDLRSIEQDRMRQSSFADNAADWSRSFRVIDYGEARDARDRQMYCDMRRTIDPYPFVPSDPARRDERCHEVFAIQATSLARRLDALPAEGRRVVVGVSGGQDSTHALLVAARAMDLLGLPRERILAATMPGLGTTERTRLNARALAEALGARLYELPISQVSEDVFRMVEHPTEVEDVTFENVQAWARKYLLFALASRHRAIDLGTGDLSELALGWCTYGGDHMSHYGVNAGVPKTLISYLIGWAADRLFGDDEPLRAVLHDILATPISPELKRPDASGSISQRSEEVVGPYELHDFFLYYFLRFGADPRRTARMCLHAFAGRHDIGSIRRWLIVFLERFFASQFKRDCLPDGPKVGSGGSLSPRGDWRMPSDASAAAWLAAARSIPEAL
jgi:NAD+ synthase (glutamine-hydrolysing)